MVIESADQYNTCISPGTLCPLKLSHMLVRHECTSIRLCVRHPIQDVPRLYPFILSNSQLNPAPLQYFTVPMATMREPQNLKKPIAVCSAGKGADSTNRKGADSTNPSWSAGSGLIHLIRIVLHRMCSSPRHLLFTLGPCLAQLAT